MKLVGVVDGRAVVSLTAGECDLIADGCRDASTPDNSSISGDLSRVFGALAVALPGTDEAE